MRRNAERGASFIIALVLLLVCTVVATVIVTSASVSVERSRKTTEEQQAYFAVSSAIKAARNIYAAPIGNVVLELRDGTADVKVGVSGDVPDSNGLETWIKDSAEAVSRGSQAASYEVDVALDSDAKNSAGLEMHIPNVALTFTMGDGSQGDLYKITVTATINDGGNLSSYAQNISTSFRAYTISTQIRWKDAPVLNSSVFGTPYMSDVWGTVQDNEWKDQWKKCKWKATGNDDLLVASNGSHYIVTVYYLGDYYIPVCVAPDNKVYDGKAMAVKISDDEASLTEMPTDGPYNCERRSIGEDGLDGEGTTKNTSNGFSIKWKKVS